MSVHAESAFTSSSAVTLLRDACAVVGLDPTAAELVRFGQNAIFRLKDQPYVVRIARLANPARMQAEVRVARWLTDAAFPATRQGRWLGVWRASSPRPTRGVLDSAVYKSVCSVLASATHRLGRWPTDYDVAAYVLIQAVEEPVG
jgi:hypothetical protein